MKVSDDYFFDFTIVIIKILIINYLFQLKKIGCDCSMDYRRNYIMVYLTIIVIFIIIKILTRVFNYTFYIKFPLFFKNIYFISSIILWLLYVIFTMQYLYMLNAKKCECSESNYKNLMYLDFFYGLY